MVAGAELDVRDRSRERFSGFCDEGAVEGRGDHQAHGREVVGAQQLLGAINLGGGAGENHLLGRVAVRDHEIEVVLLHERVDGPPVRRDGQHRATITFALGHELAAQL